MGRTSLPLRQCPCQGRLKSRALAAPSPSSFMRMGGALTFEHKPENEVCEAAWRAANLEDVKFQVVVVGPATVDFFGEQTFTPLAP